LPGRHGSTDVDGIVAAELLMAFRVIVDYSRARLIIDTPAAASPARGRE
jgi:hypothetical protein